MTFLMLSRIYTHCFVPHHLLPCEISLDSLRSLGFWYSYLSISLLPGFSAEEQRSRDARISISHRRHPQDDPSLESGKGPEA